MGVTAVYVGGLNVHDGSHYATAADTLTMLEAMSPHEPVLVEMTNRHPVHVRSQIQARPITLTIFFLQVNALQRKADYDAVRTALDPSLGLVTLTWVDTTSGTVTKTLKVHTNNFVPSNWFARASAEMVAPNPEPTVT
jgi:hypothetical protein